MPPTVSVRASEPAWGGAAPRCAAVLALMVPSAFVAAHSSPTGGYGIGIWPVGLAAGLVIESRRLGLLVPALTVGLVAAATLLSGSIPTTAALGMAVVIAAEAGLTGALLTHASGERPYLRNDTQLRRYLLVGLAGPVLAAAGAAAVAAVTGWSDVGTVALATVLAHAGSMLTLLPLFHRLPSQGAIAGRGERALQWVVLAAGTPAVFVIDGAPSLVFLVIPVLAWGALRTTAAESLAQMIVVLAWAITLTTLGYGPFAGVADRYAISVDARGMILSAFLAACAMIVVPLMLRVGEYIEVARRSAIESDRIRSIVDNATGVAIIGAEADGTITHFNPGAERLLGYHQSEVLGRHSRMLHTEQAFIDKAAEVGVARDDVVRAVVDDAHQRTLVRFRRKDGVERLHAMTLARVTDDRGIVRSYVSTSEDVTERLEEQRALHDALIAERSAVDALRQVDAAKDAFVSSVSHELRTPLTSIVGYLELIRDGTYGQLSEDQLDALDRIDQNSARLLQLIEDLLTFARLGEEPSVWSREKVDLVSIVEGAGEMVRPVWEKRGVITTVTVPTTAVLLMGDRALLERLVVNLLSNAVKFTAVGGHVDVVLSVSADHEDHEVAAVEVSDDGIGIPADEIPHLFTRFFRSRTALRGAVQGSGVGLAIVRSVVDLHGGDVEIESTEGAGTTVRVRLPLSSIPEGNVQHSTTVGDRDDVTVPEE